MRIIGLPKPFYHFARGAPASLGPKTQEQYHRLSCWQAIRQQGLSTLVSRKWLDTRSVIPAKAWIQPTLLWIPACAGKTIVWRECRTISPM